MGQLAFGIAGAVVGSFFGMPQLGFIAGSLLGSVLFPTKDKSYTGPNINDLQVQASTYGAPIPVAYGSFRMAGNVIWSLPLQAVKNDADTGGGKGMGGGGGSTQTTYTYFGNFAVAFAEGPAVEVVRIWLDKRIAYDARARTPNPWFLNTHGSSFSFRFYPGDENQVPDGLIEAHVGAGLAPAHRGICYIVFDGLNLTTFGNRLPNVEAEIVFNGNITSPFRSSTDSLTTNGGVFTGVATNALTVDTARRRIYAVGAGSAGGGIRVYDMDSFKEIRQADSNAIYGTADNFCFGGGFCTGDSGFIFSGLGDHNYDPITVVDPNSLEERKRFGSFQSFASITWPPYPAGSSALSEAVAIDPMASGRRHFLASLSIGSGNLLWIGDVENNMAVFDTSTMTPFLNAHGIVALPPAVGSASWWILDQNSVGGNSPLLIYEASLAVPYEVLSGDSVTQGGGLVLIDTIPTTAWNNDAMANWKAVGPIRDQRDGGLLFMVQPASGVGCHVLKWIQGQGVVWMVTTVTGPPLNAEPSISANSTVTSSRFGWMDSSGNVALIDTSLGTIILDDLSTGVATQGAQFYDGNSQSVIGYQSGGLSHPVLVQVFINRVQAQPVTVQTIVEDVSNRVNLIPGTDIDATALTTPVTGYCITQHMAAGDAIQPLAKAFFFDAMETNGIIVFKPRSQDPIRTLTKSQLMYVDEGGQTDDVVRETRIQEVELPQSLALNFIDTELNYLPNSLSATRAGDPMNAGTIARNRRSFSKFRIPKGTIKSHDRQIINMAIVMSASQAAQMVEAMLYTTWNERMTESFRADPSQMDLDVGDVVSLNLEDGTIITTRINKATLNADFSTSFEALKMNKITLVSTRNALGGFGTPSIPLPQGNPLTLLFLLNTTLLRDIDDTGGRASRLYIGMNGYTPNWPGGALWSSLDGITYAPSGVRNITGISYGIVSNALPATDYPFQTDNTTQLRVYMTNGVIASVSQSSFLNDANVALVGNITTGNWELIDFQNAVQQPDGSYIVSTIMRGRRGTEVNCNSHANGEFFIIPTPSTLASYLVSLGALNIAAFYRGVGVGTLVEDAATEVLTDTGNDLKPYAPCQLAETTDGSSYTLSWVRRTRLGGALTDGHGDVPLAEQTESYSIDIYNGSAVIRTLTSLTPSVNYSNAELLADFGFVPSLIAFKVYQISAAVGRGFPASFGNSAAVASPARGAREFTNEFTLEFD